MATSDVSITEKSDKITGNENRSVSLVYVRKTHKRKVPKNPKWVTFAKVLGPNLLIFVLLIGLSEIIRTIVYDKGNEGFIRTGSDLETRVSEVEKLLKKMTAFFENEVGKVDKKVENELKDVKMDLSKKIVEKNGDFVNEMMKSDESLRRLVGVLKDLKVEELVKREDFDGLFEEFRKTRGGNSDRKFSDFDFDEVKKMIDIELEKHVADGLGRVDYALASGGGAVVRHSKSFGVESVIGWLKKAKIDWVSEHSVKMISPSFGEAGECFALNGSSGFVEIRLRSAIIPEAVTLEHVAKAVAFDRTSAPKDCQISGWLQKHDSTGLAVDNRKMTLLTEFTYDLERSNVQTFDVLDTPVINTIRLDFASNHGNPTYTCIYRLRVHGREPDSVSMSDAQS